MTAHYIVFFILAVVSVVSAVWMVSTRNPVRSALFLVVTFLTMALFYVTLSAQFIAAVQVIVYAGAIMVLFLFVIMLLNIGAPKALREPGGLQAPVAGLLGLILISILTTAGAISTGLSAPAATAESLATGGSVEQVGIHLFNPSEPWLFPFEVTSIL